MENRRADDERINRIEDRVNAIQAKLNNGLSEQTYKNTKHIEELVEKHHAFETEFKVYSTQQIDDMIEVKESMAGMVKNQTNWTKATIGFLVTIIGFMSAGTVWIVTHSAAIARVLEHLTTI